VSIFDELEKRLDAADDENPDRWWDGKRDDHPNVLRGHLVRIGWAMAKHDLTPILTIREEDGELTTVWLFATVLRAKVRQQRPAPGSAIVLRYEGTQTRQSGDGEYHVYGVEVEQSFPGGDPDDFDDWYREFNRVRDAMRDDADHAPF
jgi:hypothetical protein